MKNSILKVLTFVGCALLVTGCGDKEGGTSAKGTKKASSPELALENMRLAVLAGDKEALVNCFEASGKQKEMLSAFSEFTITSSQFEQAMKKAYGEEAVKQAMGGHKQGVQFQYENWLKEVSIEIRGDTATVVKKGESEVLQLVRKDGIWKINAESMLGMKKGQNDEDIEKATKMYQAMAKAVNDVKPKIGQPGYTAEKVHQELGQAMMMAMMKAAGAPSLSNYIPK